MAIIKNIDVMLAKRKMSVTDFTFPGIAVENRSGFSTREFVTRESQV
jgi:DNA-binding Xre family transcriptional regulator